MLNLLAKLSTQVDLKWGSAYFGYGSRDGRPAFSIFGLAINVYALCIVTGMCLAILVAALLFKKRGIDPYDSTIYALAVIPIGILGARAYVFIFPWDDKVMQWSQFWQITDGGLGIYGGVIMGYVAAFVVSKIKKQDFTLVTDCLLPGVMLAQSIGRWGNYANQEAYGRLLHENFGDMINFWGKNPNHGFNGVAVWIDGVGWCQATFFYESVCTMLGFLLCVCLLTRSKHYRRGWCTAFYGIYYGIVRLVIESFRTDSLYLYLGTRLTDIKISQLVSVFTIILGVLLLSRIYRKEIHALYRRMFSSERNELRHSRWILLALSVVSLAVGVTMFVLGGESKFIIGFFATLLSVYSALGIWALCDRLKLYCNHCGERSLPKGGWQTDSNKYFAQAVAYSALSALLVFVGLFGLIKMGIRDKVSNGYVLAVVAGVLLLVVLIFKVVPAFKRLFGCGTQQYDGRVEFSCGETRTVKLNSLLLLLFPPKVYRDYGVSDLKPWVDPKKLQKAAEAASDDEPPHDVDIEEKLTASVTTDCDTPDDHSDNTEQ